MGLRISAIWLSFLLSSFIVVAGITPEQVAQKAAGIINEAKGVNASFKIIYNGKASSGTIKCSGKKFAVSLPQVSTWYDGKSLYTYSNKTQETTIINPTAQELLESNPLLYLKGSGGAYSYSFSPVKRNGKYVVDLIPRNKKSGVRKMTFTVSSANFHIERIVVDTQGAQTVVEVTKLDTKAILPAGEFVYPGGKFPKAEIVDLR